MKKLFLLLCLIALPANAEYITIENTMINTNHIKSAEIKDICVNDYRIIFTMDNSWLPIVIKCKNQQECYKQLKRVQDIKNVKRY